MTAQETPSTALWQACLQTLAQEIAPKLFEIWIRPLQLRPVDNVLVLEVSGRFKLEHVRTQYLPRIIQTAEKIAGHAVPVELVIGKGKSKLEQAAKQASNTQPAAPLLPKAANVTATQKTSAPHMPANMPADVAARLAKLMPKKRQPQAINAATATAKSPAPAAQSKKKSTSTSTTVAAATHHALENLLAKQQANAEETQAQQAPASVTDPLEAVSARYRREATRSPSSRAVKEEPQTALTPEQVRIKAGLNPRYTFDTLVEGNANRMAHAAAIHVSNAPGHMYNPLFIYGGVGLGKTHLMQSIGHQLLNNRPDAKVLYIHAEQFISDVAKASRQRTATDADPAQKFAEFRARYHSLDLLLIDDVQFFAGKNKTLEEFFSTFEALLSKKSHIVMTSDTYPTGMSNMTARVVSRLSSGLTVEIEPPEIEMRVAILMDKAQAEGFDLPEDVAFFIAKNLRTNVRELEGALQSVLAHARFGNREINVSLVREALRNLLSVKNRQISVENIQKTVADFYRIKVTDMHSKKRPANIAKPRQIAMYLSKELTQKSLPEIGEMFGGRDHTTVLHAVRKITTDRANNPELNKDIHILEQTLRG